MPDWAIEVITPWWKLVIYLMLIVVGLFSFKVRINFDANKWLQKRAESKELKQWRKRASNCSHVWTYYPYSVYSQCNFCQVYILTGTLAYAQKNLDEKPRIAATSYQARLTPNPGEPVALEPMGKKVNP